MSARGERRRRGDEGRELIYNRVFSVRVSEEIYRELEEIARELDPASARPNISLAIRYAITVGLQALRRGGLALAGGRLPAGAPAAVPLATPGELERLVEAVEKLQLAVEELSERVSALEAALSADSGAGEEERGEDEEEGGEEGKRRRRRRPTVNLRQVREVENPEKYFKAVAKRFAEPILYSRADKGYCFAREREVRAAAEWANEVEASPGDDLPSWLRELVDCGLLAYSEEEERWRPAGERVEPPPPDEKRRGEELGWGARS